MNRQAILSIQDKLEKLKNNKIFEWLVISIILVSALIIGARTYGDQPATTTSFLEVLDYAVTLFFLVEITIRMLAEKRFFNFFRSGWNVFDFIIVVGSLIPVQDSEMILLTRLLRVFRILRLVSFIPELRILVNSLAKAIPRMGYVAILMFVIFYIYGAVGSIIFNEINSVLWGDISIAMLTLFRIVTFEDWTDVMYETMEIYPLSWIFYITFIFLNAFVFLNMMIGIILNVMGKEYEEYERKSGEGEAGEVHWIKEHTQTIEQKISSLEDTIAALTDKVDKLKS